MTVRVILLSATQPGTFFIQGRTHWKGHCLVKDTDYFKGVQLGMYVVPTVTSYQNKILIMQATAWKLYVLEEIMIAGLHGNRTEFVFVIEQFCLSDLHDSGQPGLWIWWFQTETVSSIITETVKKFSGY